MCVCVCVSVSVCGCCLVAKKCPTLCDSMDCSLPGSSVHGISQAHTGEGCHFLLEGIFLTQGSNPHLLHWQAVSLPLSLQGSWVYIHLYLYIEMISRTCNGKGIGWLGMEV